MGVGGFGGSGVLEWCLFGGLRGFGVWGFGIWGSGSWGFGVSGFRGFGVWGFSRGLGCLFGGLEV